MSPDSLSVLLRTLSFIVLLQAAGIAIFVPLFPGHTGLGMDMRRLGKLSAAIALPLLAGQFVLEAARMAGDFSGVFDGTLQGMALASPAAATLVVRVLGVALILAGLSRASATARALGLGGAFLTAASFALMGHTAVHPCRVLLAPLSTTHVLIAAFWFGAIPVLCLATLRETPERAGALIERFSRIAVWVVPLQAIAGALMALLLVRRLAVFLEPYGWLLLAKMTGFALLMALAAANRLRLGPAVTLGSAKPFRRSLVAEYLLFAGIFAATATMTGLYSPEP